MKKFSKLNVKLKDNNYPIFIGEDLIENIKFFLPNFHGYSKVIIITDKIVFKNLNKIFRKIKDLSKERFLSVILPAG